MLALIVSLPFRLKAAAPAGLEKIRLEKWREPEWKARRRVAGTEIALINSYRRVNGFKAWLLVGAGAAQIVAVAALGVTVRLIVSHG
jgi:hypothetical protein